MKNNIICIDLWNTIYDSYNGFERNKYRQRVLIDELDKTGTMILSDEFDRAMKATWDFFEKSWKEKHITPSARECVEFFWKYTGSSINEKSIEVVTNAFEDSVLVHKPKLIPDVEDVLKELSKNFKLAIISDTGFSPGSILKQLMLEDGIDKYFSAFSFSNETGYSKPNETAFMFAIKQLNGDVKQSTHIGDIEHTDVLGAKQLGMNAIRFTGSATEYTSSVNSKKTDADFSSASWNEIYDYIITYYNL